MHHLLNKEQKRILDTHCLGFFNIFRGYVGKLLEKQEKIVYNGYRKSDFMKLIIGLGNPGVNYENTRHNCGFKVIDYVSNYYHIPLVHQKWQGEYGKGKVNGEDVILLKPMTYMNLSGESIIQVMKYFKITTDSILVIYDDLDLAVGKIRMRKKGSSGGHNGIKSIIQHVHTDTFDRIKVGIGKDPFIPTVDYVLGKFSKEDWQLIEEQMPDILTHIQKFIEQE